MEAELTENGSPNSENGKDTTFPDARQVGYVAGIVVLTVVVWGTFVALVGKERPFTGAFGDGFAPLTGLVTAGALILAAYSILLQHRELRAQRRELVLQREVLELQRREFELQREELKGTREEHARQGDLQANLVAQNGKLLELQGQLVSTQQELAEMQRLLMAGKALAFLSNNS